MEKKSIFERDTLNFRSCDDDNDWSTKLTKVTARYQDQATKKIQFRHLIQFVVKLVFDIASSLVTDLKNKEVSLIS